MWSRTATVRARCTSRPRWQASCWPCSASTRGRSSGRISGRGRRPRRGHHVFAEPGGRHLPVPGRDHRCRADDRGHRTRRRLLHQRPQRLFRRARHRGPRHQRGRRGRGVQRAGFGSDRGRRGGRAGHRRHRRRRAGRDAGRLLRAEQRRPGLRRRDLRGRAGQPGADRHLDQLGPVRRLLDRAGTRGDGRGDGRRGRAGHHRVRGLRGQRQRRRRQRRPAARGLPRVQPARAGLRRDQAARGPVHRRDQLGGGVERDRLERGGRRRRGQ